MPTIETCISPELIDLYDISTKNIVVVDIFRATSCMVTALGEKATSMKAVPTVEECLAHKEKNYITAGERDGVKIPEFDLGNSPLGYIDFNVEGKKVCVSTTNGTWAIEKAKGGKQIIIGAFLNLKAVADYLKSLNEDVLVLCAGWKGKFNLEDTLYAGALADQLGFETNCDSTFTAIELYNNSKENLTDYLRQSAHAKRLGTLHAHANEDIVFCTTLDKYPIVPVIKDGEIITQA